MSADQVQQDDAATLHARLETAAQLASALCDYLPGDGWGLADAIARLCRGEITPEQALAETEE